MPSSSALVGYLLLLGFSMPLAYAATCKPLVTRSKRTLTVDPFIVPSMNETNGSLPPGVCPFSEYPVVQAGCLDTLVFVLRAIPAGLRVHGVYLLEDDFVDQKTGAWRCPSPATDIDLRNGTSGGYANPGRCRGDGMTQVIIDGTPNMTAPFKASPECSGYSMVDGLDVFVPNTTAGCSTSTVISRKCYKSTVVRVNLSAFVKQGATTRIKWLVFSCPNIAGNQPGKMNSHCMDKMVVPVKVTCKAKSVKSSNKGAAPKPCPSTGRRSM